MTALGSQGKLEEADALYPRAVGVQEKTLGPDHLQLAASLFNWGKVLLAQVIDLPLWILLQVHGITRGVSCSRRLLYGGWFRVVGWR